MLERKELIADMRQQMGGSMASISQIKNYLGLKENRAVKRLMEGCICIDLGNRKLYHVKEVATALESRKRA